MSNQAIKTEDQVGTQTGPFVPESSRTSIRSRFSRAFRPLRILHIVSSLRVGGMEQLVLRIAAGQKRRGYDVSILSIRPGDLARDAEAAQIPVRILDCNAPLKRVGRAATLFINHGIGIIHTHNSTSLQYARIGKLLTGSPVVITCHGRPREDARIGTNREWKSADAVVAVSKVTACDFDYPPINSRLTVIYNGIDSPQPSRTRETVRRELGLDDKPVVIIVARIDGMKGHDTLLRAAATLKVQGRMPSTLIVGSGDAQKEMENLSQELGLGDDVRFLGFRTDVTELLAASDIFVLPSRSEGLPISALEAMSQGLPVVATPVGGVPELVEDGRTGILTPVDDPIGLASALTRLLREPQLQTAMGEAGRRRVAGHFSFDGMLDQYDTLYHELASSLR